MTENKHYTFHISEYDEVIITKEKDGREFYLGNEKDINIDYIVELVDLLNEQEETINILKHELLCKQLDKAMTEPVNCRCYVGDLNE